MQQIKLSNGERGRGVFAICDIPSDVIICEDPIIELGLSDTVSIQATILRRYYWNWDRQTAIVFGLGSMMNHSSTPNAVFIQDKKNRLMVFKTSRYVQAGEEILIDYCLNTGCGECSMMTQSEQKS